VTDKLCTQGIEAVTLLDERDPRRSATATS
jgi:hypothetical protein